MAYIYLALVDTPGILASIIRRHLKQDYIHVAISMDAQMEEAYSMGRRNPFIPFFAGFEREDKRKIYRAFPTAQYRIYRLACTEEEKNRIWEKLRGDFQHRFQYHYAVLGLLFVLLNRPFYQKNHYTCSSYIARLLEENHIYIADKHFSLVTPKDFYTLVDRPQGASYGAPEGYTLTDRLKGVSYGAPEGCTLVDRPKGVSYGVPAGREYREVQVIFEGSLAELLNDGNRGGKYKLEAAYEQ